MSVNSLDQAQATEQVNHAAVSTQHFDVLIVGAGLSGIGAGVHLKRDCPDRSFAILEGRDVSGGTWDLFRYPGIRSDSDMHTLGYEFKPWRMTKAIADGRSILRYIREASKEHDVEPHVRYGKRVVSANWCSETARWTVAVRQTNNKDEASSQRATDDDLVYYTCTVLYMCSGYYNYREGHTPTFQGRENFKGEFVHPQQWPESLDCTDKRFVVIGSGATAVTLVPNLAKRAAQVTMLQRSPSYILTMPRIDGVAYAIRKVFPERLAYKLTRAKNCWGQRLFFNFLTKFPNLGRKFLLRNVRKHLGADFDVDRHFQPAYNPWEQRLCLAPDGDFFSAIRGGKASIETDQIDTFTEDGIRLTSGKELKADVIVSATGLKLVVLGGVQFSVDGTPVDFSQHWAYRSVSITGVPNMMFCFGYVNASWTLRADLVSRYLCRILQHMDQTGTDVFSANLRPADEGMQSSNWMEGFSPGYVRRDSHLFPKQGNKDPWRNRQDYRWEKRVFLKHRVDDGIMNFSRHR